METWRKFLSEGPDNAPMYDPEDGEPEGSPTPADEDLSGDMLDHRNEEPYDPEYNPGGLDPDFGYDPDAEMEDYRNEEPYDPEYNPGGLDPDFGYDPDNELEQEENLPEYARM